MSNKSGKARQHGLVGINPPHSPMYKRRNKAKAKARKADAMAKFQDMLKGA
ncbi:MAG: hypothetical protein AB7J40_02095 [Candidatus Altimarinota bacterium]